MNQKQINIRYLLLNKQVTLNIFSGSLLFDHFFVDSPLNPLAKDCAKLIENVCRNVLGLGKEENYGEFI
jgi:hypothetical protein